MKAKLEQQLDPSFSLLKPPYPQLLHFLLVFLDADHGLRALGIMHRGRLCCNSILDLLRRLAADAHVVLTVKRNQLRL